MSFSISDFNDIIFSVYIFNHKNSDNSSEKIFKLIDVYISRNSINENKIILDTFGTVYMNTDEISYYADYASLTLQQQLLENLIIMVENHYKK